MEILRKGLISKRQPKEREGGSCEIRYCLLETSKKEAVETVEKSFQTRSEHNV